MRGHAVNERQIFEGDLVLFDLCANVLFYQLDDIIACDVLGPADNVLLVCMRGEVFLAEQVGGDSANIVGVDQTGGSVCVDDQGEFAFLLACLAVVLDELGGGRKEHWQEAVGLQRCEGQILELGLTEHHLDCPMRAGVICHVVRNDIGGGGRDANDVFDASPQAVDVELTLFGKVGGFVVGSDEDALDVVLLQPGGIDLDPVLFCDFNAGELCKLLGSVAGC